MKRTVTTSNGYFRGVVATDITTGNFIRNATTQDTLTLGTTACF